MTINFAWRALSEWSDNILQVMGVPEAAAATTARLLLRADARGVPSHGISRLPSYVQKLRSEEVNPNPTIEVYESGHVITIDADGALGQVAGCLALDHALNGLERSPMVICRLQECGHLGAIGLYALAAAEQGAVALVAQRTLPLLSLPGLAGPVIGNNPLAFAAPIAGAPPIVVDMASSVAARGQVLLKARAGEPLPPDWALDQDGNATTDAEAALTGSLLPTGGYKGFAMALFVELLAGGLVASDETVVKARNETRPARDGAVGRQSAFMMLIDPVRLVESDPRSSPHVVSQYLAAWQHAYRERGGPNARLPGERGARLEKMAKEHGVSVSQVVVDELSELGRELGVPFPPKSPAGHHRLLS